MSFPVELSEKLLQKAEKLDLDPAEIEEQHVTGGGKGGQKINKTANCVFLKHTPTGVHVRCQKHRELQKNRTSAYKLLILKLEEIKLGKDSELAQKRHKIRKQKQRRSKRAKEKMLEAKKRRGELKESRKRID